MHGYNMIISQVNRPSGMARYSSLLFPLVGDELLLYWGNYVRVQQAEHVALCFMYHDFHGTKTDEHK